MHKRLGILGGMGVDAGLRMAQQLVQLAKANGAKADSDYPDFILYNLKSAGLDEYGFQRGQESHLFHHLTKAIAILEKADCDYIVIACNTVQCFHELLQRDCRAKILNMVEISCDSIVPCPKAGVLCSQTTKRIRLYAELLERRGVIPIETTPEEQDALNRLIALAISGRLARNGFHKIDAIASRMMKEGAEKIILGCTELPLYFRKRAYVDAGFVTIQKAYALL